LAVSVTRRVAPRMMFMPIPALYYCPFG
jgi:hypothetical protein